MVEFVHGCMGRFVVGDGMWGRKGRGGVGKNRDKQFRFLLVWEDRTRSSGTTKPYGNSCFKLKIRRQRGAAYRQTIETMDARWSCALYSTGRVRGGETHSWPHNGYKVSRIKKRRKKERKKEKEGGGKKEEWEGEEKL